MAGLPGTGKSAIARRLAAELPAIVLDKDVVRAALFPPDEIAYSTDQDDFCMSVILQAAAYILRREGARPVILDGRTFSRRYQVDQVVDLARRLHKPLRIIECVCADETARRRLEQDVAEGRHPSQNRNFGLYLAIRSRFESIQEPKLTLDTDGDLDECVRVALEYVRGAGSG